jgi:hypothetical protein
MQAESIEFAHNMFGHIKMNLPWQSSRQMFITRNRDGKPRMMSSQFVVVHEHVRIHQISVSPNTYHPMIQIRSKFY